MYQYEIKCEHIGENAFADYYLISLYCSLKTMLFEVEINNDDPTEYQ